MKARQRTYEQGLKDGIKRSAEAIMCAHIVAMDDRGLCQNTIRAVSKKADFLFDQSLEGYLKVDEIIAEGKEILGAKE